MPDEKLNTFVDRLLQHVPEAQRAAARSVYSQLQDRVTEIQNIETQVREVATRQKAWWEENSSAVEERNRLRQELADKTRQPQSAVDPEDLDRRIKAAQTETLETGLGLITTLADISTAHLHEFGETLNTRELAQKAIQAGLPVTDYYSQTVAQRRQERADKQLNDRIEAARKEGLESGRKEVLDQLPGKGLPFPSPSGVAPVTTLAGLKKPADGSANPYSLEAAVATAVDVANRHNG